MKVLNKTNRSTKQSKKVKTPHWITQYYALLTVHTAKESSNLWRKRISLQQMQNFKLKMRINVVIERNSADKPYNLNPKSKNIVGNYLLPLFLVFFDVADEFAKSVGWNLNEPHQILPTNIRDPAKDLPLFALLQSNITLKTRHKNWNWKTTNSVSCSN